MHKIFYLPRNETIKKNIFHNKFFLHNFIEVSTCIVPKKIYICIL